MSCTERAGVESGFAAWERKAKPPCTPSAARSLFLSLLLLFFLSFLLAARLVFDSSRVAGLSLKRAALGSQRARLVCAKLGPRALERWRGWSRGMTQPQRRPSAGCWLRMNPCPRSKLPCLQLEAGEPSRRAGDEGSAWHCLGHCG